MKNKQLIEVREQIQEDIISYLEVIDPDGFHIPESDRDRLCQIVVDNFEKLLKS